MEKISMRLFILPLAILGTYFLCINSLPPAQECPNSYSKKHIYPLRFNAILVEKIRRGIDRPSGLSIKIDNGGEMVLIPVSYNYQYDTPFDERFWDYAFEGDSIIKPTNSYRVKVVRGKDIFRYFDIDCDAYKESQKTGK